MSLWFPFMVAKRPRPLPSHCVACLTRLTDAEEKLGKLDTAYNTLRQRVYREGKEADEVIQLPGGNGEKTPVAWVPRAGDPPPVPGRVS